MAVVNLVLASRRRVDRRRMAMAMSVSAAVHCARPAEITWHPKVNQKCYSLVVLSVPIRAIRGQQIQIRKKNHGWRGEHG